MQTIDRVIRRARVRWFLRDALQTGGWLVLAGLLIAAVLLLVERMLALPVPPWAYALLVTATLAGGPVLAWRRRPSPERAATRLDDRLGLKDRLSSALYAEAKGGNPFARQVVADGEQAAHGLRVKRAVPVRPGAGWAWAAPAAALVVLLAMLVPPADLMSRRTRRQPPPAQQARARQTRERIRQVHEMVRKANDGRSLDPAREKALEEALASLTDRDLTRPEARREAMVDLAKVKDQLSETGREREKRIESLKNRMTRLETRESGPADDFTRALRRGDFSQAQHEMGRLQNRIRRGELSPAQQQRVREQLRSLSRQMDEMGREADREARRSQQQTERQLRQAGVPEKKQEQLKKQDYSREQVKDAVEQAQRERGASPRQAEQQAEQTAKQIQKQQQQRRRSEQARETGQGLSNSLGRMARSEGQPSSQPGKPSSQGRPEAAGSQPRKSPQGQQRQPGGTPSPRPSQPGGGSPSPAGQKQSPGQQDRPDPGSRSRQANRSGAKESSPGQGREQGRSQPGSGTGGTQARRQLEKLARRQQQARRTRQAGAKAGEAMRRMAGGRRPNSGRGRGGRQAGRGPGGPTLAPPGPGGSYQIHAEGDLGNSRGRVITSWKHEGNAPAGEAAVEFNQAVTRARDRAERAVTENRVPRRYHQTVKDYFNQLPDSPPARD